jgi:tRNA nucleotidyltransferase (CCA-adding enzyme)
MGIPSRLLFTGFKTTICNPGMSKNLETAIGKVFGLDIDLVNLRTGVYTPSSQSPNPLFAVGGSGI